MAILPAHENIPSPFESQSKEPIILLRNPLPNPRWQAGIEIRFEDRQGITGLR
jgi:hypothetical protein